MKFPFEDIKDAGNLLVDYCHGAIAEKMEYNRNRPDHKPENRKADGGKKY